eukprot:3535788-Rhodomonas_salina.4
MVHCRAVQRRTRMWYESTAKMLCTVQTNSFWYILSCCSVVFIFCSVCPDMGQYNLAPSVLTWDSPFWQRVSARPDVGQYKRRSKSRRRCGSRRCGLARSRRCTPWSSLASLPI